MPATRGGDPCWAPLSGSVPISEIAGGLRLQVDAVMAAHHLASRRAEPAIREGLRERPSAAGPFIVDLRPCFPASPELHADAPELLAGIAAFIDPTGDGVFFREIL